MKEESNSKENEIDIILTDLKSLKTSQLQSRFVQVFGETTRSSNRTYLIRRIIWGIQMKESGGLSQAARRKADELGQLEYLRMTAPKSGHQPKRPVRYLDSRLPKVGSIIRKSYKGRLSSGNRH